MSIMVWQVAGSIVSLMAIARSVQSNQVDGRCTAPDDIQLVLDGMTKALAFRREESKKHRKSGEPDFEENRFVDVQYTDLVSQVVTVCVRM